jgi:hypothetical protein
MCAFVFFFAENLQVKAALELTGFRLCYNLQAAALPDDLIPN